MDIQEVLVSLIDDSFILNCRRTLNVDDLKESIESSGLQIPIGVKKTELGYGLIYGFRRFNAVKELCFEKVTCRIIDEEDEGHLLLLNLQENVTRKNLTAIEEAQSLSRIISHGKDIEDFRKTLGWSKTKVTQRLALLDMADSVQDSLQRDMITVNQARAIDEAPEHLHSELLDEAEKGATVKSIREQVDLLLNIIQDESSTDDIESSLLNEEEESLLPVSDTHDIDLDIYSSIVKGFLLDLGSKFILNDVTMFNYEVIVRSIDFSNLKSSELAGFLNITSMLESSISTFGTYEKRKNELK